MSILKHEKEILVKSERRSLDEVHDLTARVHRLQVFLAATSTTLKSHSRGFLCFAIMDDCVAKKCD